MFPFFGSGRSSRERKIHSYCSMCGGTLLHHGVHRGHPNFEVCMPIWSLLNKGCYYIVIIFYLCIVYFRKADQLKEQICTSKDINSPETLAHQQQLRVCTLYCCLSISFNHNLLIIFRSSTSKSWLWTWNMRWTKKLNKTYGIMDLKITLTSCNNSPKTKRYHPQSWLI